MGRRVIFYELNEVPLRIYDEFIQRHPDSLLGRRSGDFAFYETFCEDEQPLSPWVTWPTLERGVVNKDHGILHFGQELAEIDRAHPPFWKLLAAHGISTGVFGALHTYPLPEDSARYAFYVPDTFANGPECHPPQLSVFQEFNLSMARESARNVSTQVSWKLAARFLASAPRLGLRLRTLLELAQQLAQERRLPWRRVRRRTFQTVVGFDLFLGQLEKTKPAFSTFFTNHAASAMHRYWAAAFPGDYSQNHYPQKWIDRFSGEIDFAMIKTDEELARLVRFAERNPDYVVIVTSSMGQAATRAREARTQTYLRDVGRFMSQMGLDESDWEQRPAMDPEVNVLVRAEKAAGFREAAGRIELNGKPLEINEREHGFFNLKIVRSNKEGVPPWATVGDESVHFEELGLENVEIEDQAGTSAYHIPEGSLLVFDPQRMAASMERPQISTLEIAPFLLRNFGVPVPDYMRTDGAFEPF